jgi:hypothetical protein
VAPGAVPGEITGSAALVAFALVLLLAGWLVRRRNKALTPTASALRRAAPRHAAPIEAARKNIETLAKRYSKIPLVTWTGAVDLDPRRLAYWIFTRTDAERDRLAANQGLVEAFRVIVRKAGYPASAVPKVGFGFESKETVDRDFGGNYWRAMK